MFENFHNARVIDIVAYGADDYDYTPNILGFGISIGETGYMEIIFSCGSLFFSTNGITTEPPVRSNAHRLAIDASCAGLIGEELEYISKDKDGYTLKLYGCHPIACYLDKNDGSCDRDYFSLDALNPDAQLMK